MNGSIFVMHYDVPESDVLVYTGLSRGACTAGLQEEGQGGHGVHQCQGLRGDHV